MEIHSKNQACNLQHGNCFRKSAEFYLHDIQPRVWISH